MTKAEIRQASENELQRRWIELHSDPRTWRSEGSEQHKEFLLVGEALSLLRDERETAIGYAEELWDKYQETLSRQEGES